MAMSAKDLVAEARAGVPQSSPAEADGKLILDVREPGELSTAGAIAGAVHVPRGTLEFKADPGIEGCEAALKKAHASGETVHLLCASGGRATLAAATLKRMGYDVSVIEGGLKGWKDAGLPVSTQGGS